MALRVLVTAVCGLFVAGSMTAGALVDGAFVLPSESMLPTFEPGDKVFVRDVDGPVRRGDVVIARSPAPEFNLDALLADLPPEVAEALVAARRPQRPFQQIARVVGVGGDHLEIRDGRLHVNGAPADEPYLRPGEPERFFEPIDVPAGHVYLMGDNRIDSRDSRAYGPIPVDTVKSIVVFRYWPLGRVGTV